MSPGFTDHLLPSNSVVFHVHMDADYPIAELHLKEWSILHKHHAED
jgi:hypothetical protein